MESGVYVKDSCDTKTFLHIGYVETTGTIDFAARYAGNPKPKSEPTDKLLGQRSLYLNADLQKSEIEYLTFCVFGTYVTKHRTNMLPSFHLKDAGSRSLRNVGCYPKNNMTCHLIKSPCLYVKSPFSFLIFQLVVLQMFPH